jgi:hypothetical protein
MRKKGENSPPPPPHFPGRRDFVNHTIVNNGGEFSQGGKISGHHGKCTSENLLKGTEAEDLFCRSLKYGIKLFYED